MGAGQAGRPGTQARQADQVGQAIIAGQAARRASDARTPLGTFLFVVNRFLNIWKGERQVAMIHFACFC